MTRGDIIIKTEGLTKDFTGFWGRRISRAVDNLDLVIYSGEIMGLLGPNGSGKTTTMKLLLGLIFPTAGSALVLGRHPLHIATKERIGFLPEESYLYRFLNAVETMDFYGKLFGMPRKQRATRSEELLRAVGLWEVRRRPLREYSKGMLRRIGLAQALINDPELVFLDEPTAGLDPIVARQMKDMILELKRRGKTVLMSSHLLADVEDVCDRISILHEGKLRKVGSVQELLIAKDTWQVDIRNLTDEGVKAVEAVVAKEGATVSKIGHPSRTLESLFLKTIEESRSNKGSSE
ncbi:MAG: ABC transporter ATP-binding protein [Planctomycetota bacterium]|nr:ABC transporter ATP-binding protein [Planctomycetota bacterium]